MAYYVSARKRDQYALLVGPFRRHGDALAMVDAARRVVHDNRRDTWFDLAYGTCRDARGHTEGKLNALLGVVLDAAGYVVPITPPAEQRCLRCARAQYVRGREPREVLCFYGAYCADCAQYRERVAWSDGFGNGACACGECAHCTTYSRAVVESISPRRRRRAARRAGEAPPFNNGPRRIRRPAPRDQFARAQHSSGASRKIAEVQHSSAVPQEIA